MFVNFYNQTTKFEIITSSLVHLVLGGGVVRSFLFIMRVVVLKSPNFLLFSEIIERPI